jgi:pseudaminic acid cytidylyltransferase
MNIAIITARGGSKRIPRKNIKDFCGKAIIAYPIEAALKSGLFDEVMVSTDDKEIAQMAQQYGAKVPFLRSEANANDFATTADVLREVLMAYQNIGKTYKRACCLYPTAPFVDEELLNDAFQKLDNEGFDCVFPVQKFGFPIQRALRIQEGRLAWMQAEHALTRSQDLEAAFHDTGQFYFFDVQKFLETGKLLTENTSGIEISEMQAHDIDTPTDWEVAEFKYRLARREI